MAKKTLIIALILPLLLLFASGAKAEELVNKQLIEEQPINVVDYAWGMGSAGLSILERLAKSMDPVALFNGEIGVGGVKFTLIERFIHKNLYLTGGWIVGNGEPRYALYGIEAKLKLKGNLGKVLSKLRPGVYWSNDKMWFGISLELKGFSI